MIDFKQQPGMTAFESRTGDGSSPLVSIITAYYNAHRYIGQTVQCVLNQTFPWFEWIIVDDGSDQEESLAFLQALSLRDSRIRVVHQSNQRLAAARNRGIKESRTDIIIPLDADDLISPTYVERTFFGLYFNPEATWCYTDGVGFGAQEYEWVKEFSSKRMKTENILVCTAAIRKIALESVNGYSVAEGYYNEDWELWLKLLAKGCFPVHLPGTSSFWYRRSDSAMLSGIRNDKAAQARARRRAAEAAQSVPDGIRAKAYPNGEKTGSYPRPEVLPWERKVWPDHSKINLLMLLPWTEMGGADLFNLDVIRRIDPTRYNVTVLTTQVSQNAWSARFETYTPDVLHLPDFLDPSNFPAYISYVIQSRDIDILFLSNSYYGYMVTPWLRKTFPQVAVVDYVHMEEWYWRNGGYARASGMLRETTDHTLVCNEATRKVMIEHFDRAPESVGTLYIGVDHLHFDPSKIEDGIAKQQHGIEKTRPVILFPCRIHPQKRPFLMLEIAKSVHTQWPQATFLVVGDGPQLQELRIKAHDTGLNEVVYFAGRQDDMRPYYRDAIATLICSLKEGLALTAYESLSMGVPVITSDVGGQAELVDSVVGEVLPLMQSVESDLDKRSYTEEEIEQYVQAILRVAHMTAPQYETMSKACRERIVGEFSSEQMIKRLQRFFETLLTDPSCIAHREESAKNLAACSGIAEELATLYAEIDAYEYMYKHQFAGDIKNELMRMANSKWGSRLIKLTFKLKLNKLLR